jgi:hypothetical protein
VSGLSLWRLKAASRLNSREGMLPQEASSHA